MSKLEKNDCKLVFCSNGCNRTIYSHFSLCKLLIKFLSICLLLMDGQSISHNIFKLFSFVVQELF